MISWKDLDGTAEEATEIEFKGVKFWAMKDYDEIQVSQNKPRVVKDPWQNRYRMTGDYYGWPDSRGLSCDSCAFQRINPELPPYKTGPVMLDWYLSGLNKDLATVAYLTKNDGKISKILPVLLRHGFNRVAVNPSREGRYNVYMLVHPGKKTLKSFPLDYKKNNIDEQNAVATMD